MIDDDSNFDALTCKVQSTADIFYEWSVVNYLSLNTVGKFGLLAMALFLFILVVGFIYEWKKGALEWD